MSDFSARLVALRQRRGYSQEQLALKMGITKQTISNYERDIRSPDREMIERLANILDCSVGYLMGTEGEINAQRKLDEIRANSIVLAEDKLKALLDQPDLPSNVRPISSLHRQRSSVGRITSRRPKRWPVRSIIFASSSMLIFYIYSAVYLTLYKLYAIIYSEIERGTKQ